MLNMIQSHAISLFKCTMSDRVSVNPCVWLKLEELFQHSLLELKCNVHPLDGISNVHLLYMTMTMGYKVAHLAVIVQWQMLYMG